MTHHIASEDKNSKTYKRIQYEKFLKGLPTLLTKIDDKYDNDNLLLLFQEHKENLKYFQTNPKKRINDREQLEIFINANDEYEQCLDRNNYIGSKLANYGKGHDEMQQAAFQVQNLLNDHKIKVKELTDKR